METPLNKEEEYEIENIAINEGCMVSLLKYITLSIIVFIALWIGVLEAFSSIGFEYRELISFIISIGITGYFLHKIFNKSDEVYKIIFDDKGNELILIAGNTFDGVDTKIQIQYDSLSVSIEEVPIINNKIQIHKKVQIRNDKLSQNRKVKIFDSNKLMRIINVDLSKWCRHEKVEYILEKLVKISNKKMTKTQTMTTVSAVKRTIAK